MVPHGLQGDPAPSPEAVSSSSVWLAAAEALPTKVRCVMTQSCSSLDPRCKDAELPSLMPMFLSEQLSLFHSPLLSARPRASHLVRSTVLASAGRTKHVGVHGPGAGHSRAPSYSGLGEERGLSFACGLSALMLLTGWPSWAGVGRGSYSLLFPLLGSLWQTRAGTLHASGESQHGLSQLPPPDAVDISLALLRVPARPPCPAP
nr:uncharacterized protein LOC103249045 [Chlorocebus sabaeus]